MRKAITLLSIGVLLVAGILVARSVVSNTSLLATPNPIGLQTSYGSFKGPPTTAQCISRDKQACYSPLQLQTAYDMEPLYNAGLNGRGETIAIVDSFGSPTVRHDLARFDQDFSLPAPPSFRIIAPVGKVPPYNPNGTDRQGWAVETAMDVEYAHAMAPGANLLLVETPVDETIGTTGFPQIVKAENYVINKGMAQVITQSFGAAEQTFHTVASLKNLRSSFVNAQAHHVTVLASTGDQGPTSFSTPTESKLFTSRAEDWPASDPLVTAVGGTAIHLNDRGLRSSADSAWNDCPTGGCVSAGGGGVSSIFPRPSYQNSVSGITGNARGFPDISMSADPNYGPLVYTSFAGPKPGYHIVGGTSESSPLFSGIVAVADQANGSPLGLLNPKLYALGAGSAGLPDVTSGNTTVSFKQSGKEWTVKGFSAVKGYDLATGLGTVDGAKLVEALTGVKV